MYHYVNWFRVVNHLPWNPGFSLTVSPEIFKKQMDWLEEKTFRFLSLDETVNLKGKISLGERAVAITFDDGFQDNYQKAFSLLIGRKKPAALFVVVHWVGQKGFMRWKEIKELSDHGITIGSHSLTHRRLKTIADDKELEDELVRSKKEIEDRTGKEVRYFSYPVGIVDKRVLEKVKRAGYRAAWVAGARPDVFLQDSSYTFRRVKITPSDSQILRFAIKAYGLKGLLQNRS